METVSVSCRVLRFIPQNFQYPKLPLCYKAQIFPQNSRIYGVYDHKKVKAFTFVTHSCTAKKWKKKKMMKKAGKNKIVFPDSDDFPVSNGGGVFGPGLSILQLPVVELVAAAGLMALGNVIEQGEAPSFLGTWALLGASLMACTNSADKIPLVKIARRLPVSKQECSETTQPKTSEGARYERLSKVPVLNAFKGLLDLIAPFGLNLALISLMSGGVSGASGDFTGSVTAPRGLDFTEVHMNQQYMDSRERGELQIVVSDSPNSDVSGTTEDSDSSNVNGIATITLDNQSITLCHKEGKIVEIKHPNSRFQIEAGGTKVVVDSTGLDHKSDRGVPIVSAGFGAFVLTACINYLSNAEIWSLEDGKTVVIRGNTNQGKGEFSDAINRLLDEVPEILESSSPTESDDHLTG